MPRSVLEQLDSGRYYGNSLEDGNRLLGQARVFNIYTERLLESLGIMPGSIAFAVDLGSGSGAVVPCLAQYAREVIAVDNDGVKLGQAASVIEVVGLRDRVGLVEANVVELPDKIPTTSAGLINMRLFLEHVTEGDREGIMKQIDRIATPNAIIVAEDFDLGTENPTWNSEPQSESHRELHRAMASLYRKRGAEPGMGPRLVSLFQRHGWDAQERTYSHWSDHADRFTPFHWSILDAMQVPITKLGIMSPEDFTEHRARFEADLKTPGTKVCTPLMYQVVARRAA